MVTNRWQIGSIAWECSRDGLGDMMVSEAELVFVWVILDGAVHDRRGGGCDFQHGE